MVFYTCNNIIISLRFILCYTVYPDMTLYIKYTDSEGAKKLNYKLHTIKEDCSLVTYFNMKKYEYRRGHAFYEFTNDYEDISRKSTIILIHKVIFWYYKHQSYSV